MPAHPQGDGAGAVAKTDWQALKFRYCWIWPDHNEPGHKAAKHLKKILPDLHIVEIPSDFPEGNDLGDVADDFDIEAHLKLKPKSVPATMEDKPNKAATNRAYFP